MSRPSKTEQEQGYIRDWWHEVRVIEAEYHGTVTLYVVPLGRPGVWQYRMVFTPLMDGQPNGMGIVALTFVYPNAEQSTLAGFLWRKAIALARMVDEAEGGPMRQARNGA